jgi:hypothetical protein
LSPAGLDEDHLERGEAPVQAVHRLEVDRGVLADRRVRAAAGFHPEDAIRRERLVAHQELGVFLGVDVVGDRGDVVALAQRLAQGQRERGLARAYRPADADAKGCAQHPATHFPLPSNSIVRPLRAM